MQIKSFCSTTFAPKMHNNRYK